MKMAASPALSGSTKEVFTMPEVKPPVETAEVPTELQPEAVPATAEVQEDLPQGASKEQQEAFQKMRQEIKAKEEQVKTLEEQLNSRVSAEKSFNEVLPRIQEQPADLGRYTNPITGEMDMVSYNRDIQSQIESTRQQAYSAGLQAQSLIEEYDAKKAFPELDPDSKTFDPNFEKAVASQYWFDKQMGKSVSIKGTASELTKWWKKEVQAAEAAGAAAAEVALSEKERASLAADGQSSKVAESVSATEDLESLRQRTRVGDDEAIVKRLKNIPPE